MHNLLLILVLNTLNTGWIKNSSDTLIVKKQVLLDHYFNNEYRINAAFEKETFHYTLNDTTDSGYSVFGNIFKKTGATISHLTTSPTKENLKNAAVYIIVDPDTKDETLNPNFINQTQANTIYDWVKRGGVLLLLMNDSSKADFSHTNILAQKFGIQFIENSLNKVVASQYESAALYIPSNDAIFKTAKKVYIKELSSLKLSPPAKAHHTNSTGDIIIATAKIGKGRVFAVGDPWFYNEYIDNRRLPQEFENYKAAHDLVKWLLSSNAK
jgi:unsaturated rhamnogalacturonyl hydrolase